MSLKEEEVNSFLQESKKILATSEKVEKNWSEIANKTVDENQIHIDTVANLLAQDEFENFKKALEYIKENRFLANKLVSANATSPGLVIEENKRLTLLHILALKTSPMKTNIETVEIIETIVLRLNFYGADVNAVSGIGDEERTSVLMKAIEAESSIVFNLLLKNPNTDINLIMQGGKNAGDNAIDAALDVIANYVQMIKGTSDPNYRDYFLNNMEEHIYFYQTLVDEGAKITTKNVEHAIKKEILELTLHKGKNISELYAKQQNLSDLAVATAENPEPARDISLSP